MPLSCRFYSQKLPAVDDVVMVKVRSIGEMGAYVQLLQYNGIEGMILLSELSRRRIRSINKLIRVGRCECVVVIRVDNEKGYIDLSKRRVTPEDIAKCEDKFARGKSVHSILAHVAELLNYDNEKLEELFKSTAWHFDQKTNKPSHCYDVFKLAVNQPSVLDECGLEEKVKEQLLTIIKHRMKEQTVKTRADIEVGCYAYEGVDAVKDALRAGIACGTEETPVKINLIAAPRYVVTTNTMDSEEGVTLLNEALTKIEQSIKKYNQNGLFKIITAPKVVTEHDDNLLAKLMEQAQKENEEVSGDEDGDPEVEDEDSLE